MSSPSSSPSRLSSSRASATEVPPSVDVVSQGGSVEMMVQRSNSVRRRPQEAASVALGNSKNPTYLSLLIQDFNWALTELGCEFLPTQLEEWAVHVHSRLTRESRGYHGIKHVFEISQGAPPLVLLAAIFRDVINSNLDGHERCPSRQEDDRFAKELLETLPNGTCRLVPLDNPRDRLVAGIFGVQPGDDLEALQQAHSGVPVFLSALTASRLLQDTLTMTQIAQMTACLNATIPFRGMNALDSLYHRLIQCRTEFEELQLSDDQIVETVQWAADLHNRNLGNLLLDLPEVLAHTWSLLPEQHVALRQHSLFYVADFYRALYDMVQLLQHLQGSSDVYISFRGLPTLEETNEFHQRLQVNLQDASIYMQARLLTVAVVLAFASLTGGDAPLSFFFGDVPSLHYASEQLGDGLLREAATVDNNDVKAPHVYNLLANGDRVMETDFDRGNAPLAAYLYRQLGDDTLLSLIPKCTMPLSNAWELLGSLPYAIVEAVGHEIARFVVSRRQPIQQVLNKISVRSRQQNPN